MRVSVGQPLHETWCKSFWHKKRAHCVTSSYSYPSLGTHYTHDTKLQSNNLWSNFEWDLILSGLVARATQAGGAKRSRFVYGPYLWVLTYTNTANMCRRPPLWQFGHSVVRWTPSHRPVFQNMLSSSRIVRKEKQAKLGKCSKQIGDPGVCTWRSAQQFNQNRITCNQKIARLYI